MDTWFNGISAVAALLGAIVPIILLLIDRRRLVRKLRESGVDPAPASRSPDDRQKFEPAKETIWREGVVRGKRGDWYVIEPTKGVELGEISLHKNFAQSLQLGDLAVGAKLGFRLRQPWPYEFRRVR